MNIVSTPSQTIDTSALVADFGQSSSSTYDVLVGIGLDKTSDAVFFQYKGDEQKEALMQKNGKPVSRIYPVQITGVKIEENPYANSGFTGCKLNIEFTTQGGKVVCLTSGLTTMWSQCMLVCLSGLMNQNALNHLVAIDSWKGDSKYGTCFAAIRDNGIKVTDQALYDTLVVRRAIKNKDEKQQRLEEVLRDTVSVLQGTFDMEVIEVQEIPALVQEENF